MALIRVTKRHLVDVRNCKSAHVECVVTERRKRRRVLENEPLSDTQRRQTTDPIRQDLGFGRPPSRIENLGNRSVSHLAEPRQVSLDSSENHDEAQAEPRPQIAGDGYVGEFELAKQHLIEFFNQDLQFNPIKARSTYVGSELSNLNFLTRQRSANQHVYHYPCSNVYVPRVFRNSQTPATPNFIPRDAFILPPSEVSDVLIEAYFTHVHPTFPIIDKDKFYTEYRTSRSSPPILLLQAVCLVGSHVSTFKNVQDLKVAFFRRAKALLDGRYEEDRMHVVQAALLLTWFSDGGDDICANAWWWIGVAARCAIGLGMHRDVGHSKMPDSDKRTWRMIWWCLVQFDCLVSLFYGRPQAVNLNECDAQPLQLEDFDSSISLKQATFVMQHAKLCTIISELVQNHFSIKARQNSVRRKEALDIIDTALAGWVVELPPDFREHSASAHGTDISIWPPLLHLTYNTVLIQFHRPSTSTSVEDERNDPSNSSGEICADAASNIIRIFQQLRQQSALHYCWFWAPSSLFTAMLQISGELKCSNRILALRSQEKYESGLKSLGKLARHWLSAISVLRLYQSSTSEKLNQMNNGNQQQQQQQASSPTTNNIGADDFANNLEIVSPTEIMSTSTVPGVQPTTSDQVPVQLQEMDWVQPPSVGDPNSLGNANMHFEFNRWQNNLNEWQSLYWSDPLAIVSMDDSFTNFGFEGLL